MIAAGDTETDWQYLASNYFPFLFHRIQSWNALFAVSQSTQRRETFFRNSHQCCQLSSDISGGSKPDATLHFLNKSLWSANSFLFLYSCCACAIWDNIWWLLRLLNKQQADPSKMRCGLEKKISLRITTGQTLNVCVCVCLVFLRKTNTHAHTHKGHTPQCTHTLPLSLSVSLALFIQLSLSETHIYRIFKNPTLTCKMNIGWITVTPWSSWWHPKESSKSVLAMTWHMIT